MGSLQTGSDGDLDSCGFQMLVTYTHPIKGCLTASLMASPAGRQESTTKVTPLAQVGEICAIDAKGLRFNPH